MAVMALAERFLKDLGRALNAAEDGAGPVLQRGGSVRPLRPKGRASLYRLPVFVGLQKKILPKKRYAFFGSLSCHSLEALKG